MDVDFCGMGWGGRSWLNNGVVGDDFFFRVMMVVVGGVVGKGGLWVDFGGMGRIGEN